MAKRRTWLWILVTLVGLVLVCVIAMAGFGMYFVSRHVHAGPSSSTDAFQAFDNARLASAAAALSALGSDPAVAEVLREEVAARRGLRTDCCAG